MPAEQMHTSRQGSTPGEAIPPLHNETQTDAGLVIPAEGNRQRNVRETIDFGDLKNSQRSDKYTTQGVNLEDEYNAFYQPEKGAEATNERVETHERAIGEVAKAVDGLETKFESQAKVVGDLKRQVEEKFAEKALAEDQPRRVRNQDGVTEKLVKFANGSFEWQGISVDEPKQEKPMENVSSARFAVDSSGEATDLTRKARYGASETEQPAEAKEESPKNEQAKRSAAEVSPVAKPESAAEPNAEAKVEAEVETEAEAKQAQKWWKRAGENIRKVCGAAFWGAKFEAAKAFTVNTVDNFMNRGVSETMTDWEKEEQRRKNRNKYVIAGAAIGVVLLGGKLALQMMGHEVSGGLSEALGNIDLDSRAGANGDTVSMSVTPEAVPTPEAPKVDSLPLINDEIDMHTIERGDMSDIIVGSGMGGEALFRDLGIDTSKWYENAQHMVTAYPQDFYLEGNDVRIAHPGKLSAGAQSFINSLR